MRIVCLVFILLTCWLDISFSSTGNNVVAYGDVPFGISYKQTKSLLSSKFGKVHRTISSDSVEGLIVWYRKGNDLFHFKYGFRNDKLIKCTMTAPKDFIKDYFNKKYGKPTSNYSGSVSCGSLRYRGTYDIINEVWERPKGKATLKYVCEQHTLTQHGIIEAK